MKIQPISQQQYDKLITERPPRMGATQSHVGYSSQVLTLINTHPAVKIECQDRRQLENVRTTLFIAAKRAGTRISTNAAGAHRTTLLVRKAA